MDMYFNSKNAFSKIPTDKNFKFFENFKNLATAKS